VRFRRQPIYHAEWVIPGQFPPIVDLAGLPVAPMDAPGIP
jgi:hypothetical protein